MIVPVDVQIPIAAAFAVFLLVVVAEQLHLRRCRIAARLAVGPSAAPRPWVGAVPLARALALAAMAWSVATLGFATGGGLPSRGEDREPGLAERRIIFLADLSPSMLLEDAGPKGNLRRSQRAGEVVEGILRRVDDDNLYTVIAFYTDAATVVLDAQDPELVSNVFDGLPLWYVMEPGKTDVGTAVRKAFDQLAGYAEASATVFLLTDGDTIDLGFVPAPPAAVSQVYVLGVGDPQRGTFIDDHLSRQDAALLNTLAGRLRGSYLDVNEKQLSHLQWAGLARRGGAGRRPIDVVDVAIAVFAAAALAHGLLPLLLEYFGSDWKPVRIRRPVAVVDERPGSHFLNNPRPCGERAAT